MVGDTRDDVTAGVAAGVPSLGVLLTGAVAKILIAVEGGSKEAWRFFPSVKTVYFLGLPRPKRVKSTKIINFS